MRITDLTYLETLALAESSQVYPAFSLARDIIGGDAALEVGALAAASGEPTYTLAAADTQLKSIANGRGAIAKGRGTALAIGDDPYATTFYTALGFDRVKVKVRTHKGDNFAYETVKIKAIDRPNK